MQVIAKPCVVTLANSYTQIVTENKEHIKAINNNRRLLFPKLPEFFPFISPFLVPPPFKTLNLPVHHHQWTTL